ncbi:MAG: DUF4363 family protein [Eubacteriales bacterium]|nr:DUF4363 family protein [Eubacteriales bacterium]
MARRIATVCIVLLLLFLFIVPSMSLKRACLALRTDAKGTLAAVFREDWDDATALLTHANDLFFSYRDGMHLYLNHQDIAELETALKGCLQMARVQENGQLLLELEHILTHLDYLESIENLTLFNLL